MEIAQSKVIFKFKASQKSLFQVRILGSTQELGNWSISQGVIINCFCDPFWLSEPVLLPTHTRIEYKYYLYHSESEHQWEPISHNRILFVRNEVITVEDEESVYTSKIHVLPADQGNLMPSSHTSFTYKFHEAVDPVRRVIVASQSLPFQLKKEDRYTVQPQKGIWTHLLYKALAKSEIDFLWVGTLNIPVPVEDQDEVEELMRTYHCIPVFVEQSVLYVYREFTDEILWNLMNNITHAPGIDMAELWQSYREVNLLFAEAICTIYNKHLVWVHDYHLMLTPEFLTRKTKEVVNIGLSLHSPFPSSEIFRTLPYNDSIMYGLCCCDLIGFHSFEYARHFIGACKRVLGVDIEFSRGGYHSISFSGRNIMLKVSHMGIEPSMIEKSIRQSTNLEFLKEFSLRKTFMGIDPLDRMSGIHLKFRALQKALRKEYQDILFVQVLTTSKRHDQHLLEELQSIADEVNDEFGTKTIEILLSDLTAPEKYGLMSQCSGLVNTSIRDGLYFPSFEYIIANKAPHIITSEFSGVSRALSTPIRVNPFNSEELEKAISSLLFCADTPHFEHNLHRDLEYISSNTTSNWVLSFLKDLSRASKNTKEFQYVQLGITERLKIIALPHSFHRLNEKEFLEAYTQSRNRAMFFDNEGTLCSFVDREPSPRLLKFLDQICRDKSNSVFVITGRERKLLEERYDSIQFLGMAAEYGAFMRWNAREDWEKCSNDNDLWKQIARDVMEEYADRIEGSYLVEKEEAVGFIYRSAEPEYAQCQAKDLQAQLDIMLRPFAAICEVSAGVGYIEVKPLKMNKGNTLANILQKICVYNGPVDFAFAIGDDVADEHMFTQLHELKAKNSPLFSEDAKIFTCKVGMKQSSAKFYVHRIADVINLLEKMKNWSTKVKKNNRNLKVACPRSSLIAVDMTYEMVSQSTFTYSSDEESSPFTLYTTTQKS